MPSHWLPQPLQLAMAFPSSLMSSPHGNFVWLPARAWRELASLDGWTRRRLRCVVWVQWKTRGNRYRELRRLEVTEKAASAAIFSPKGPWRLSSSGALHRAFTNRRFKSLGLFSMDTLAGA